MGFMFQHESISEIEIIFSSIVANRGLGMGELARAIQGIMITNWKWSEDMSKSGCILAIIPFAKRSSQANHRSRILPRL